MPQPPESVLAGDLVQFEPLRYCAPVEHRDGSSPIKGRERLALTWDEMIVAPLVEMIWLVPGLGIDHSAHMAPGAGMWPRQQRTAGRQFELEGGVQLKVLLKPKPRHSLSPAAKPKRG